MQAKHTPLVLSALLAALISSSALAVTQVEAHAQLGQIPVTENRAAAREVLDILVSSGVPVDRALAVVSDAVKQNVDAGQLHKMGSEIRTRVEQNVPVEQAYGQVRSEFTSSTIGATQAVTAEGNPGARAGDASGSMQVSASIRPQNRQPGFNPAGPGAALVTGAPAIASNPAMAMNPASAGVPRAAGNPVASATPGAPAGFGAAGNARTGSHR